MKDFVSPNAFNNSKTNKDARNICLLLSKIWNNQVCYIVNACAPPNAMHRSINAFNILLNIVHLVDTARPWQHNTQLFFKSL